MSGAKTIQEMISCKRDGGQLSEDDLAGWVEHLTEGGVADCQLGAWLMAVYIRGLDRQEVSWLTKAMVESGDTLNWPKEWMGQMVDKHSTGGVGDKVSLPLAPALAACGLKVPMISGRGLGITGGTLDKLESIPGYKVQLSTEQITGMMEEVGCCIVGQTGDICPADKIMYATRDITETVGSLGLITSSIVSKKIAEGISSLVLDIKWGKGCYQDTLEQAEEIADALLSTSESLGVRTTGVISHMDSPLGMAVGNSLEVLESLACLRGEGKGGDLRELVEVEGAMLLLSAGLVDDLDRGRARIEEVLDNGEALAKFKLMMMGQGVEDKVATDLCEGLDNNNILPVANNVTELLYQGEKGWVTELDAMSIAKVAVALGAGRALPDDVLDLSAGVELMLEVGDMVEPGQVWALVHHNKALASNLRKEIESAISVSCVEIEKRKRITRIIVK